MSLRVFFGRPVISTTQQPDDLSGISLTLRNTTLPNWPDPDRSIGRNDEGIPINGRRYWAVQGPALLAYTTIESRITTLLKERKDDLYEGLQEEFVSHSVDCFMVGRRRRKACPFIVIGCDNASLSRRAMDLIKSCDWWNTFLDNHEGFGRFAFLPYQPRRVAGSHDEDQVWIYTSDQVSSLCGAPIFSTTQRLKPNEACHSQQATMGGIVYRNRRPCGLTAAHPFVGQPTYKPPALNTIGANTVFFMDDIDDMDDDDDDSSDSSSIESRLGSRDTQSFDVADNKQDTQDRPIRGDPVLLGRLVMHSGGGPDDALDWALVDLAEGWSDFVELLVESSTSMGTYTSTSGAQEECPAPSQYGWPSERTTTPILVSGTSHDLVGGVLSASQSLICLPGTRKYVLLYRIHLAEEIAVGDCGKWAFDGIGKWYGHIVAGVVGSRIAYIVRSSWIYRDIFRRDKYRKISLRLQNPVPLDERLLGAIYQGQDRIVSLLLERGADANSATQVSTILHTTSSYARQRALSPFNDAEADETILTQHLSSALYVAAEQGSLEIVEMLLARGAAVNALGGRLGSPLQAAVAYQGSGDVVAVLLAAGADVNRSVTDPSSKFSRLNNRVDLGPPLHVAAYYGNVDAVCVLLASDAEVNLQEGTYCTALQAAAADFGKAEVVQLLLDNGAELNIQGGKYGTALQAAARATSFYHESDVVRMLLDAGADVFAGGGEYGNAFNAAAVAATQFGSDEIFRLLVDFGKNEISGAYRDNFYTLTLSIMQGDGDVQRLIEDAVSESGTGAPFKIALYVASAMGKDKIVREILKVEGNLDAQDERRETALHAASAAGHEQVVRMLIDAGAQVDIPYGRRLMDTALCRAVERGHGQVVQLLVAAGADVNPLEVPFGTVLNAARRRGNEEIVRMLEDAGSRTGTAMNESLQDSGLEISAPPRYVPHRKTSAQLRLPRQEDTPYNWSEDRYSVDDNIGGSVTSTLPRSINDTKTTTNPDQNTGQSLTAHREEYYEV